MTRIAFIINFNSRKWLGGFNFILNLIKSLSLLKNKKIKLILIVDKKFDSNVVKNYDLEIVKTNFFSHESFTKRIFNKFFIFFFGKSFIYDNFFKYHKIDVLSHYNTPLGKKSDIKNFPWLTDLQFLHYPQNFSFKNRILKKINIKLLGSHSDKIILSSKNARKDLKKISVGAYNNSVVNSFTFGLLNLKEILSLNKLKKKYKIKKNFFYLPNQYFVHKNHIIVIKALNQILREKKNKNITIISTGHNSDHRNLNHFKKIVKYIKNYNLKKNYIYLGIVPYQDMMSLIYHSIGIINPSKFEGWSSSVEQAKSMGKKIILSDLPVHREQKPNRAKFFKSNDFKKLSKILRIEWVRHDQNREKKIYHKSYGILEKRLIKFANNYLKIITKNL